MSINLLVSDSWSFGNVRFGRSYRYVCTRFRSASPPKSLVEL